MTKAQVGTWPFSPQQWWCCGSCQMNSSFWDGCWKTSHAQSLQNLGCKNIGRMGLICQHMQGVFTFYHELQNTFRACSELVVRINNPCKWSMNLSLTMTEKSLVKVCINSHIVLKRSFGMHCKLMYYLNITLPCQFLSSSIGKRTADF